MNKVRDMDHSTMCLEGLEVPVVQVNTVVIGTGSAGYCAADRLAQFGQDDVIVVADKVNAGTSRNAGSDKQTYYKPTLSGNGPDSVGAMARTLFDGGAMDGDIALVEAAMSARCFYNLVEAGVEFPSDRYGQFSGYKTDHDPRQRATSAGPFTSQSMVEHLEQRVRSHHTPVFGAIRLVDLLVDRSGETPDAWDCWVCAVMSLSARVAHLSSLQPEMSSSLPEDLQECSLTQYGRTGNGEPWGLPCGPER